MKKVLTTISLLLPALFVTAQKREELFDYTFKPATSNPYYLVFTEKEGALWHRKAYFFYGRTLAMEAWFKDDSCTMAEGALTWYHTTKFPKSTGTYVDGQKQGLWLGYDFDGMLIDSANYEAGRLKGIRLKWHRNGMLSDSLNYDGLGNGAHISWYDDGLLASAGYWEQDSLKKGRWKYFDHDGSLMATEDYVEGKKTACTCFDSTGQPLDPAVCMEKEAEPQGGAKAWRSFWDQHLLHLLQSKLKQIPEGKYTVIIRFSVERDGTLADFSPLTNIGNGIEEEVVNIFKQAPRWTPRCGLVVRCRPTEPNL